LVSATEKTLQIEEVNCFCLKIFVESPSPDKYDLRSSFERKLELITSRRGKNTSFCFGAGREAFDKVVLPGKSNQPDRCVPGPGSYANYN
jgi:hypothetical protein